MIRALMLRMHIFLEQDRTRARLKEGLAESGVGQGLDSVVIQAVDIRAARSKKGGRMVADWDRAVPDDGRTLRQTSRIGRTLSSATD